MTTEREVLANQSEARQECLRPLRQSKAAHASLEFALWLMTVLGTVVHARSRSDENMLILASSGSVTILSGAEHSLEEALGRGPVTPLPKQDTVSVDGAPRNVTKISPRRQVVPGAVSVGHDPVGETGAELDHRIAIGRGQIGCRSSASA